MLTIAVALVVTLTASAGDSARSLAGAGRCPHGDVEFVGAEAQAHLSIRFVSSQAAADCVVRWTTIAPGPGEWREGARWPAYRLFATDGIADLTVFIK